MHIHYQQEPCILLVDDEPQNIQLLAIILKNRGYLVEFATSGSEALQWVQTRPFDLILLDVMMPGMDGYEVCTRLKHDLATREIPIIFLTARTDPESVIKGFQLGAVDYVTKPFQKDELLARVKTHLALIQQQRDLDRYAQELQQKNAQLEELNATKDTFFSIVAHDLKTPLTSFLAFGELLNDFENLSSGQKTTLIRMFKEAAHNLLTLLENLLTWSRLQRGQIEFLPQPLNVQDFVVRNVNLFTPAAKQKQITLHNRVQHEVAAYADLYMLDAVMRNVLSNAIKFTPSGGAVTIDVMRAETLVTISVADTGIGIPAEKCGSLFRIDAKYQRKGTNGEPGTGLGLVLCKEFVQKQGGVIRVESREGNGTTLYVTLPVSAGPPHE